MGALLVGALSEAWADLDRVLAGLSEEAAAVRLGGGSAFSWTAGHVTNQLDSFVNVRFQSLEPHQLIGQPFFRFGGTGEPVSWQQVREAVKEVQDTARSYLERLSEEDLERSIPYTGSLVAVREYGSLSLYHALTRIVLHHYFHIGEIATKRVLLGHDVGDYPGPLRGCL